MGRNLDGDRSEAVTTWVSPSQDGSTPNKEIGVSSQDFKQSCGNASDLSVAAVI